MVHLRRAAALRQRPWAAGGGRRASLARIGQCRSPALPPPSPASSPAGAHSPMTSARGRGCGSSQGPMKTSDLLQGLWDAGPMLMLLGPGVRVGCERQRRRPSSPCSQCWLLAVGQAGGGLPGGWAFGIVTERSTMPGPGVPTHTARKEWVSCQTEGRLLRWGALLKGGNCIKTGSPVEAVTCTSKPGTHVQR